MVHDLPAQVDVLTHGLRIIERRLDALVADLAANMPAEKIAERQAELKRLLTELDAA